MTYMNDANSAISGINLLLRPVEIQTPQPSLKNWLKSLKYPPIWITHSQTDAVARVLPILPKACHYSTLIQAIYQQLTWDTFVEWQNSIHAISGVEINTQPLHTVEFSISAITPLSTRLGRGIHALFFRWIDRADSAFAAELHQQSVPAFSLSIQSLSPRQLKVKVNLFKPELLAPLLWGMSQDLGQQIRLGRIPCYLSNTAKLVRSSSFEALTQVPTQNVISLEFLSLTSFKQQQKIQPFPLPELVFGSLWRRWNYFAPIELQFPEIEWDGMVLSYDLKTQPLQMDEIKDMGAIGQIDYRFSSPKQARIATILAHFAQYSGVGRKTAMGMGEVGLKE